MRPSDNIEKLFRQTNIETNADVDKVVLGDAVNAMSKSKQNKPVCDRPEIWRIIMQSKMTKFAAAAVIIIGVLIGINQFGGSIDGTTTAYAMSDVPELFYSARNIHTKAKMYFPEAGEEATSRTVEVEHWLDIENGRWRSIKPNTYSGPEGFKLSLSEEIFDGGEFELDIDHGKKEASFTMISELQKNLRCRRYTETMMAFICGDPQFYDLYENIGTEVINGHSYNIWELTVTQERMGVAKMQSWLSPETGDIAKAVLWIKKSEGDWAKKLDMTTIEQNTVMADELFAMEAPGDYKLVNTRQSAHEGKFGVLVGGWSSFVLEKYLMFGFGDGSVIMCWASRDNDAEQSQADLFAGLEFGGDFPKLPNEVYALETNLKGRKKILQGRHLCYTEYEGKFYEWGIYVPREKMSPFEARVLSCTLVCRNHSQAKSNVRLGSTVDLLIRDADDFDTFVLGAMAELSDDAIAPEGISYENVLDLIEDIR